MGKGAVLFLLTCAIICVFFLLVWHGIVLPYLNKRHARRKASVLANAPWTVIKDQDHQACQIKVIKPGEEPFLIGEPIPITLPHWEFDEELTEKLIEGQYKADSLNRRLPA